jgi:3-hydroxyisobutyrate dehydrogenase-like beta-hydroxyacid dehydrogenase
MVSKFASFKCNLYRYDTVGMLQGKTISVVGYGDIGRACAQRAKALGMRVVALRRNPQRSLGDECVDELLPLTELHSAMAKGDFVVLSLPHTPQTEVGLVVVALFTTLFCSQSMVQLMTDSSFTSSFLATFLAHVTELTPGSENPDSRG